MEKKDKVVIQGPLSENRLPRVWLSNPYIHAATSKNTRLAYQSDIRHYEIWGGKLPANPENIVAYLSHYATKLSARTLARRLVALKQWHTSQGFADPTKHPAVTKTMIGITRVHGKPKEKARPVTPEELHQIVSYLSKQSDISALRDKTLLQLGFCGAFRRSELVAISYENLKWEKEGVEILIPNSKTDANHEGQYCSIPYGNNLLCPISALKEWLQQANITFGPIFRRIIHGVVGQNALSPLSVNLILKKRAEEAGISESFQFSSHSLRRGLATSAARAGSPLHAIMRAGRWKQTNTVVEYIEASERFNENAAAKVLQQMTEK